MFYCTAPETYGMDLAFAGIGRWEQAQSAELIHRPLLV